MAVNQCFLCQASDFESGHELVHQAFEKAKPDLRARSLIYRSNRSLNYRAHAHFRVTVQQFQPQRDFPPLALTFLHRAFAAADNLARAAALIFRLILRLFGDGSAASGS